MAKKKAESVKKVSYLFGTFIGKGKISISADTSDKDVQVFLKNNPNLEAKVTNKELIESQRKLIK
tara:strand:+ start:3560 stop:3754 length:195 start_codon:yes stop_codon:yes gene_type:complete